MKVVSIKSASFEEMKGKYPETLYKYRTWTDLNHKKVLTEKQLFFSPPSWFEDPKDCKSPIRYDLLSKQEKIKWIEFKLREDQPSKSRNYYRSKSRELFKTSLISDNKKIKKLQEETFKQYDLRTGVLSLTGNPDNDEMWRKYSDNGKGYCVGFNPLILFNYLGGGGPVRYVPTLPKIFPEPKHSKAEQLILQVFFKEDRWSFEEEYRTRTFRPDPMMDEDRIINVPSEAFTKIILGQNMSEADKKDLKKSLSKDLKHVEIVEK